MANDYKAEAAEALRSAQAAHDKGSVEDQMYHLQRAIALGQLAIVDQVEELSGTVYSTGRSLDSSLDVFAHSR
jgi:hypothetical protein